MAETDDKKVLKMSLICSICLQKLNKPRSLPCFHTFCEACLKNYFLNSPEKFSAGKDGIPCPSCKLNTFAPKPKLALSEWAENFPVNHLVGTLIDIVPVSSRLEFCEPCKDSKMSKVAKSWCQQCSEALCDDCTKCHMSMKATRSHELTGLENVRSNPQQEAVKEDIMCQEHTQKDVDMFCQDHELPCCAMCIALYHRKCNKICPLDDAIKVGESVNVKSLFKDMDKLVSEADALKRERQKMMINVTAQKAKFLQDIATAKKKLMDHIERIESQIMTKFNAISETDVTQIEEQVEFCNSVQRAMHHTKTAISSAKDHKQAKKEFIVTKLGQKKYEECSNGLKTVSEKSAKIQYAFEENPKLAETLAALEVFGKLDLKHTYPNMKQKHETPSPRNITAQIPQQPAPEAMMPSASQQAAESAREPLLPPITQCHASPVPEAAQQSLIRPSSQQALNSGKENLLSLNFSPDQLPTATSVDVEKKATRRVKSLKIKVKGDRRECKVTAIKLWNSNKILLADNANARLKLFNENGDIFCIFDCTNPPWDFTFIDKSKCAVTMPNERKVKIFHVKETIKEVGWLNAARGCYGITIAGDDLAVTFSTGCIRIISLDGSVRMMVDTDYIGKRVFSNPEFIAFNPNISTLYVSDYNNHNVTALRFENGAVNKTPLFVYRVSGPRGVSVDIHGNLYVCGFWSNDIHKVRECGEFMQILKDALSRPLCLAFSGDGVRFALSEQDVPNTVKIFRLIPANEED